MMMYLHHRFYVREQIKRKIYRRSAPPPPRAIEIKREFGIHIICIHYRYMRVQKKYKYINLSDITASRDDARSITVAGPKERIFISPRNIIYG